MRFRLRIIFSLILIGMLIVTTWATMQESIAVGAPKIIEQPWGIATLFDTYFGFLTFYIWVFYKERAIPARLAWFIAIMALGNIAMAVYALIQIQKSQTDTFEGIFLRSEKT